MLERKARKKPAGTLETSGRKRAWNRQGPELRERKKNKTEHVVTTKKEEME